MLQTSSAFPANATSSLESEISPAALLAKMVPRAVARPRSKPLYQINLVLVTMLCVLAPLAYFALVAGVGWLLYAYYSGPVLEVGGHGVIRLLAWITPGFVGGVVILFMLKPLFAPRYKPQPPVELAEGEEAEFVAGVHALCAAIGVRPPSAIHLNYQVNAWVQFEHGWRGLLGGRRQLSIGLPLVAGMSSRQLVGVLAHEFGHFAQGAGMRCSYVINSVNRWLESRAYHPDEWDERLQRWREESDNFYTLIVTGLASLSLWFTRLIMRGLFQLSFRSSRRLSQEMEFDADRYEALVAGSACFRSTALQLRALSRASHETNQRNALAWREGKLVADLPAAIKSRLERLDAAAWSSLNDELHGHEETRYWDSHPADQARIANAEALDAAGLFLDERPASLFLRDFPKWSRRVTEHCYRDLGLEYSSKQLADVSDVLELNQVAIEAEAIWKRYSNGMIGHAPLLTPSEAQRPEWRELGWQACVDQLRQIAPDVVPAWQRLEQQGKRRRSLALWVALIDQGIPFRMPNGVEPDGVKLRTEYGQLQAEDSVDLRLVRRTLALFARRLACAVPEIPDGARSLASQRLALVESLQELAPRLEQMAESQYVVASMARAADENRGDIVDPMYVLARSYRERTGAWLEKANTVSLPGSIQTLGQYLLARCARLAETNGDDVAHARALAPLEDAFMHLYRSQLAELAVAAEAAEQAAGIRPIRLWSPISQSA